jgi:DNA-binding response OmpR family regulator
MEKKKKILIADDETAIHNLLPVVLSSEFDIIYAYNGQETVELIDNEQPDLVVLDIIMPIKDGRDICRDLKKNPKTKNIRVLMLSARAEQHDRILGLGLGADDYLAKPVSLNHLASKIEKMLKKE